MSDACGYARIERGERADQRAVLRAYNKSKRAGRLPPPERALTNGPWQDNECQWLPFEFHFKPGNLARAPAWVGEDTSAPPLRVRELPDVVRTEERS